MTSTWLIQGFHLTVEQVVGYINSRWPDTNFTTASDMSAIEDCFNSRLTANTGMSLTFDTRQVQFVLGFVIGGDQQPIIAGSDMRQLATVNQLKSMAEFELACQTLQIISPAAEAVFLFIHTF